MYIVFPVSSHDIKNAEPVLEVLKYYGGLDTHKALVVASREVQEAHPEKLAAFADGLKLLFGKFDLVLANRTTEPSKQLLKTCPTSTTFPENKMFQEAVYRLGELSQEDPFLWFELDCAPAALGWADKLERLYLEARIKDRIILGQIRPTIRRKDGKPVEIEGDFVVNKIAVFPPVKKMIDLKVWKNGVDIPLEVMSRWEWIKVAQHTDAIHTLTYPPVHASKAWILNEEGDSNPAVSADEVFEGKLLLHSPKAKENKCIAEQVLSLIEYFEKQEEKTLGIR